MSIFFNNSRINDWYYNSSDIIKVYHNGAVCYYKLDSSSPSGQTPCFAVVDDITQYTETEFEDVFDKATEKWYKLNNLNQYEEYGVYASGRTICEGSTSRLPQGYTEVEYIRHSNDVRVQNVWSVPNDAVDGNIYTVDLLLDSTSQQGQSRFIGLFGWGSGHCQRTNRTAGDQTNAGYHCSDGWHLNDTIGNYYQEYDVKLRYRMTTSALTITNTQTSAVTTLDFTVNSGSATGGNFGVFSYTGSDSGAYQMRGNIYQIIIEGSDNTIKHQYIPCQRNSDSQYGLYDLIGEEFYYPTTITISGGEPVTPTDCVTTYEGKLTIDEETSSRLPQGYTEVEYIENTSYVANTKSTTRFNVIGDSSSGNIYTIVYDLYDDSGSRYLHIFGNNVNVFMQKIQQVWADKCIHFKFYGLDAYAVSTPLSTKAQIEIDSNSIIITNLEASTSTTTTYGGSITSVNETHYGVFCCYNNNDNGAHSMVGKIYEIKIESSNHELKNHYIPCYRDSDNKVGLYDIVGDAFYYDESGELSLSSGDPIAPTSTTCEFIYSGNSWVNVGEVSGSSKTSDFKIGDIKERVTTSVSDGDYLLFSYYNKSDISKPENIMSYNPSNNYLSNLSGYGITSIDSTTIIDPSIWVLESTSSANTFYIKSIKNNLYWGYQNTQTSRSLNLVNGSSSEKAPVLITPSCKENCYGFVEKKSNASTGYGGYGLNQLYDYTYQLNWLNNSSSSDPCTFFTTDGNADFIIYKMNASDAEYPINYDEKSDPPNNLSFSSMTEAETYAYNNCVYDGLRATIDGELYTFDSEEGWVEIPYYYKFEDVTPSSASGWTITESQTYNPDSTYYDDYSLENSTTSNVSKIAKITIFGYESFTYYIRSFGYSTYVYVTSSNVDEIQTDPTTHIGYNSTSAITNTYYFNKNAGSSVNLSNYRRITYNNLDKNVEHTFYITFYGRSYSSYYANATILIPKEQTNENWEQVTFTSSSNVSGNPKNLYVDGNYSSSGGTQYFCYRWMLGLPSGNHSSNVSYSNYNYCPDVTSSTFTSVAGNSRLVEYSYNGTTNKTLQFRLVDESGNTINTADTVYYSMTYYNSCGTSSSSSNLTFPRGISVKVGGRFNFTSSSNRHYIYGYEPNIQLNTSYYSDNYETYFDIPYTKLSTEAVTVTYVTYDPNDVEVPAFLTKISYPYGNSGATTNTLTSYDVPYTYTYDVAQTNNKFSADSQSFTASGASRTVTFTLYPNNRDFSTVADLEAYQYAWEGMRATVGDTKYKYTNGEWVEQTHSLPDVPFVLNYNAKEYDAITHTIAMTVGQLNDTDAVAYNNPSNIVDHSSDGYITISNSSMRIRKENQDIALFNRTSNSTSSDMTIVCKAKTTGGENVITNRDSNYNWMYRLKSVGNLTLHGVSETGGIQWNINNPDIMSVRTYYDSGTKVLYNNWTKNTSSNPASFTYGSTNGDTSKAGALFVGYSWSNVSEQWSGDFYWVYMAQAKLTDEQIQQVIDYNENL